MLRLGGVGFAPYPHIFLEVNVMPTTLPWYNHCYAARFPVLLEGVGKLFSGTFDAIYSDTQTDTLAVFLSCTVLALVAALFFSLWHNSKK